MTGAEWLREWYSDIVQLDRRPEGMRYRARLPDGTRVIATLVDAQLSGEIRHPDRFTTALQRASSVHHEAIARPLAWGAAGDGPFLHFAYPEVEREAVAPGSLTHGQIATAGRQLTRALEVMHASGLMHGAISTDRIGFTADHGPMLFDFGLFEAFSGGGLGVQRACRLLGDDVYCSPEVLLGQEPDELADVYSLGASLYELLTGKPPYGGRTTSYVMATVLSESGEARATVEDEPVVEALLRAIERQPADRWASAAAFGEALSQGTRVSGRAVSSGDVRSGCLPNLALVSLAAAAVGAAVGS